MVRQVTQIEVLIRERLKEDGFGTSPSFLECCRRTNRESEAVALLDCAARFFERLPLNNPYHLEPWARRSLSTVVELVVEEFAPIVHYNRRDEYGEPYDEGDFRTSFAPFFTLKKRSEQFDELPSSEDVDDWDSLRHKEMRADLVRIGLHIHALSAAEIRQNLLLVRQNPQLEAFFANLTSVTEFDLPEGLGELIAEIDWMTSVAPTLRCGEPNQLIFERALFGNAALELERRNYEVAACYYLATMRLRSLSSDGYSYYWPESWLQLFVLRLCVELGEETVVPELSYLLNPEVWPDPPFCWPSRLAGVYLDCITELSTPLLAALQAEASSP